MTKISVLMPVYKTDEKYLKLAITSILMQTFKDFEFLILDDCPEDSREKIVNSFSDERIKYFKNEKNLGIALTRNRLLALAEGEYLAVMDHDDISLPERLEKEAAFLDGHPEVGVVGCWYQRIPDGKIKKRYILNGQIERDLMWHCSILHPSAMIRKKVLEENNLHYEEEFSPAEDYALLCRLLGKTHFANLPEVLFQYRDYKNNTSKKQAVKMKEAAGKIHEFVRLNSSNAPEMSDTIRFLGLPVMRRKTEGCTQKTVLFGIFKFSANEEILDFAADGLPIYIICFNRLSYLQMMISHLEKYGFKNIHIIDNCSSYPPLLEYLRKTPYTVHHMDKNYGHMVFFKADEFKSVRENEYYVLTDPDVIPLDECPQDYLSLFYFILRKYPQVNKVGFSLKTDDICGDAEVRNTLQRWESQYYKHKLNSSRPYLYKSAIDTTFALYRPQKDWRKNDFYNAVRTGYPYQARHLPWYKDLAHPSEEDLFYSSTDTGSGNWNDMSGIKRVEECLRSKMADNLREYLFSVKESRGRRIIRILGLKFTVHKQKNK